jgi:hypothetical protein
VHDYLDVDQDVVWHPTMIAYCRSGRLPKAASWWLDEHGFTLRTESHPCGEDPYLAVP